MEKVLDLYREISPDGEILGTYLGINTHLIRGGLLGELTPSQLKVLLVIAAHMNDQGQCFPSLETIARLGKMSMPTVIKSIKELLNVKVNGNPLMLKEYDGDNKRARNKYTFGSIEVTAELNTNEESTLPNDPTNEEFNAKAILFLFMNEYKEEFGIEYKPSWVRDLSLIKNHLIKNFTDDEIRSIIHISVSEYKTRWYNPKFPAPTIGAICKWICNESLKIHKDREQRNNKSLEPSDTLSQVEKSKDLW